MKRLHLLGILLTVLVLSSCGLTRTFTTQEFMSIQNGMPKQEVTQKFGTPDLRRFMDGIEEWEYRGYVNNVGFSVVVISFEDDHVIGLNTFKEATVTVTPEQSLPPITVLPDNRPQPLPGYPHRGEVMSANEFDTFYKSLKSGFSSERMKKIDGALQEVRFTSAQCQTLLKLFAFSSEQVELLKTMYPSIADKRNFDAVIETLAHGTDKRDVRNFVENYNKRR